MQNYPQYSACQKWNHWLSAILVCMVVSLLLFKITLSQFLGGMFSIYLLHKSFGVVVFLLTIWRIYINIKQGVPNVLPYDKKLQRILSKSIQGFIYILLLLIPLSGYLMSSHDLNVFGVISIPAIDMPNAGYMFFHRAHLLGCYLLAIFLVLHIVGALYHYFGMRDKVLQSML